MAIQYQTTDQWEYEAWFRHMDETYPEGAERLSRIFGFPVVFGNFSCVFFEEVTKRLLEGASWLKSP